MKQEPTPEELAAEEARVRRIQWIVNKACLNLCIGIRQRETALALIADTRRKVLELAPDDADKFDLIYAPRLRRFAQQFAGLEL